jgi:ankyrin repeat protein
MSDEMPSMPPDHQALVDAAAVGDVETVRRLLKRGVDPNARGRQKHLTWDHTALMFAAENGHAAVVRELLAAGADVAAGNRGHAADGGGGSQALHFAAAKGHVDVCALLLDAGANPNVLGRYCRTPLTEACYNARADVIRLLLSRGGDVKLKSRRKDYEGPAFAAVTARDPQTLRLVLDAGADPNATGGRRSSPLQLAAGRDDVESDARIELMDALIQAGAAVDLADQDGTTALQIAIAYNNVKAVRFLLAAGADATQTLNGQPLVERARQYEQRAVKDLGDDLSKLSEVHARTFRAHHEKRRRDAHAIIQLLETAAITAPAAAQQGTR